MKEVHAEEVRMYLNQPQGLRHGTWTVRTLDHPKGKLLEVVDGLGRGIGFLPDGQVGAVLRDGRAPVFLPMEAPLGFFMQCYEKLTKLEAEAKAGGGAGG